MAVRFLRYEIEKALRAVNISVDWNLLWIELVAICVYWMLYRRCVGGTPTMNISVLVAYNGVPSGFTSATFTWMLQI